MDLRFRLQQPAARAVVRFGALVGTTAVLAACTLTPATSPPAEETFVAAEATNMFRVVYGTIAERYTDPVDIGDIATDGLRGLTDVDSALSIGRAVGEIELSDAGHAVTSIEAPPPRDSESWSKLSVKIWRDARRVSPALAAATPEQVYEHIFDRVIGDLDVNGHYATAAEARRTRQRRSGYIGIGIGVGVQNGEPVIVEVTGRSPAERAGLRVGDALLQIDGRPVRGLSTDTITQQLQDDVSGWVQLVVRRPKRGLMRFVVLKSYLIPDTVRELYDDGILYLKISHFNQGTADDVASTLATATDELRGSVRGIILDLRGNPGGLLQQAVKVADLFLTDGPILSTRGRHPDSIRDYVAGGDDEAHGLPLVILVDGDAASAAELVAATLQDRGRAVIVGSSTYGKGTVQTVLPLPNGGELSFTWSRAIPPSGSDLRGRGVRPIVCTSGLYVADNEKVDRLLQANGVDGMDGDSSQPAVALGCPAEQREGPLDAIIARRLIENPVLYAQLLRREAQLAATAGEGVP